jgi:hypothetical protein
VTSSKGGGTKHPVETKARVKGQSWKDPPFVLQINTIKTAGAGTIIDDVDRHNRSLGARRIDRQHGRCGVERGGLNLAKKTAAQSMTVVDPPAGVGLLAAKSQRSNQ